MARKTITIDDEHEEVIEEEALNLSKWVRKKLEEQYPEYFD